jgi:hypothetical protein
MVRTPCTSGAVSFRPERPGKAETPTPARETVANPPNAPNPRAGPRLLVRSIIELNFTNAAC